MKTFEEFLTEEPVIKRLVKHYIDSYNKFVEPSPAKARRIKNQDNIDNYKLQYNISQDLSVPVGKRKKAAIKAQTHLDALKKELGM